MTAVKFAIFLVALIASHPMAQWLRRRPALRLQLWTLIGLLPFILPRSMALISFRAWPGDTFGVEVSLVDWLALCLLVAARPPDRRALPFRTALAAYFLVVLFSATQARWALMSLGYAWKLGRMILLLVAIWRAGREDRQVPAALLRGMTMGIVYEGALAVWQHAGLGIKATGSFAHQNTLGMLTNLVVMASIARILAGPTPLLTKLAPIAAVLACLFTVSRGALLFLGLGCALVFLLSLRRGFTPRKAWIGLAALLVFAAVLPIALRAIETRAAEERAFSVQSRGQYEKAATTMVREHPLGVGANHYATEVLLGGYGARAGIWWGDWTALVHNVYLLTLAELGYAGLAALALLFLGPLLMALKHGLRRGGGRRGDVLLGLGVGLATLYAHGFFEWVWRLTEVSYVYFMTVGMIPVLALQMRKRRSPAVREEAPAAPATRPGGSRDDVRAPLPVARSAPSPRAR